jgi:hypothetical protein
MGHAYTSLKPPFIKPEKALAFTKSQGWAKRLSRSSNCLLAHLLVAMIAFEKALLREQPRKHSISSDEITRQFFKALRRIEKVLSKGRKS